MERAVAQPDDRRFTSIQPKTQVTQNMVKASYADASDQYFDNDLKLVQVPEPIVELPVDTRDKSYTLDWNRGGRGRSPLR